MCSNTIEHQLEADLRIDCACWCCARRPLLTRTLAWASFYRNATRAKALYVEITVVEADDARLYKALVRWLAERGKPPREWLAPARLCFLF